MSALYSSSALSNINYRELAKVPISFLNTKELSYWHDAIQLFDEQFTYPLDAENKFRVSHGQNYNAYFDRMGEARHALMHSKEGQVIAIMSFIKKLIELNGKPYYIMYVADLKIDFTYRGKGLTQQFYTFLLTNLESLWFYAGCPLLYFVGMEGNKGTIMRSFKGFWSRKFLKPIASMKSYLISPRELLNKLPAKVSEDLGPIYNLSTAQNVQRSETYSDCKGVLNFYFDSNAEAANIAHLNIGHTQGQDFVDQLYSISEDVVDKYDFIAFALDERRQTLISALENKHIITKTRAVVGGLSLIPGLRKHIVHLNTDEI